jgi:alpha-D-ribose 1-methylphosphonate 5-phosphate C-P lyase
MAHPAVLRNLVEQYVTLRTLHAENGGTEVRRRMDDVAYTLCVSTGTRDVDAALIAARHRLPGARTTDDSLLTT